MGEEKGAIKVMRFVAELEGACGVGVGAAVRRWRSATARLRIAELQEGLERCEEDLRRKREEAERLEAMCGQLRSRIVEQEFKIIDQRKALGDATADSARLRRELGKRR